MVLLSALSVLLEFTLFTSQVKSSKEALEEEELELSLELEELALDEDDDPF